MSNIDKQALRQLAVDAKELAIIKRYTKGIEAQKKFIAVMTPATVLALLDELEAAEKRIAELETREVKLPQRQEPTSSGHYGEGYLIPSDNGIALNYEDTAEALAVAGINFTAGTAKGE